MIYQGCSSRVLQLLQGVLLLEHKGPAEHYSRWKFQTLHFPKYAQTLEEEAIWLPHSPVSSCIVPSLRSCGC